MQSDAEVVEIETWIRNSIEKPYAFKGQKQDSRQSLNSEVNKKPKMIVDISSKLLNKSVEKGFMSLD